MSYESEAPTSNEAQALQGTVMLAFLIAPQASNMQNQTLLARIVESLFCTDSLIKEQVTNAVVIATMNVDQIYVQTLYQSLKSRISDTSLSLDAETLGEAFGQALSLAMASDADFWLLWDDMHMCCRPFLARAQHILKTKTPCFVQVALDERSYPQKLWRGFWRPETGKYWLAYRSSPEEREHIELQRSLRWKRTRFSLLPGLHDLDFWRSYTSSQHFPGFLEQLCSTKLDLELWLDETWTSHGGLKAFQHVSPALRLSSHPQHLVEEELTCRSLEDLSDVSTLETSSS